MLQSGMDLHKRTAVIATVDADGRRVREAEPPTTGTAPYDWATVRRVDDGPLGASAMLVSPSWCVAATRHPGETAARSQTASVTEPLEVVPQ